MKHLSHQEYVEERARDIVKIADKTQTGAMRLLLAACQISSILTSSPNRRAGVREEDFLFLKGVHSECDGLPLGEERQYWAEASLREKDIQAQSYEQAIQEDLRITFSRVVQDIKPMP